MMVDGFILVLYYLYFYSLFVGMVGYWVGVASVAMATCGMQSVLHTHQCSTLGPYSQTEGVKWEHICADQCAG